MERAFRPVFSGGGPLYRGRIDERREMSFTSK